METITIRMEIPKPSDWEISVLKRLMLEMPVAPDGLYDPHTAEKGAWLERLLSWGAILHSLPGENNNIYYLITKFGEALLEQAEAA